MQKFAKLTGLVMPLDRGNVDTDAIIPKQYLKSITSHRLRTEPVRRLALSRSGRAGHGPQPSAASIRISC